MRRPIDSEGENLELKKLFTKKTEAEVIKEALNLV